MRACNFGVATFALLASIVTQACGDPNSPPALPPGGSGGGNEEDSGAAGQDGGNPDAGPDAAALDASTDGSLLDASADSGTRTGPIVTITSPAAATDPLVDLVLTGGNVTATCSATRRDISAAGVDATSIVMRLHRDTETGAVVDTANVTQLDPNTFEGVFTGVDAAGSGMYWIECEASDTDDPAHVTHAYQSILYDAGPDLAFVSPSMESQIVGQMAALHLEVIVAPRLLGASDPEATVTAYELTLGGVVIPITATTTVDHYSVDVDLLSTMFEPPPSGPTLVTLEASNMRGQTRRIDREIVVDNVGPVITVTGAQMDGALVRGVQTIRLQLSDALAGPNMTSVVAYVANDPVPVMFTFVTDHYEGVIDTSQYGTVATQLPIRIEASDRVGNVTDLPLTLRVDNVPPIVSLDPPMIREVKKGIGSDTLCSSPFDPVGADSTNDQEVAPQGPEFRARIEDQNPLNGDGVVQPVADVDPNSATVYMMNDLSRPMLIDTNADGACDALNDELDILNENPSVDDLLFVRRDLSAIAPAGRSEYPASAPTDGLGPSWDSALCTAGADTVAPPRLCSVTSPLTRVIKAPIPGSARPAIWGLAAVDTNNCVGRAWDWGVDYPRGGPVCVVARAEDTLGNVGVSVPLRVCLQRSSGSGIYDCNANLAWQNHNCLAGTYRGQTVSCTSPPDFGAGYVREDSP